MALSLGNYYDEVTSYVSSYLLLSFTYLFAICSAISAAFKGVATDVWDRVELEASINRSVLFGVGVVHGLLVARQMFGSRGLSQFYSLTTAHMQQSVEWVLWTAGQDTGNLIQLLTQVSGFSFGGHIEPGGIRTGSDYVASIVTW